LNSEYDEDGKRNTGSHWTALVIDDNKQAIYFDSYGLEPPKDITNMLKSNQYKIGNTKKNV
jgi:Ulp1 family protease